MVTQGELGEIVTGVPKYPHLFLQGRVLIEEAFPMMMKRYTKNQVCCFSGYRPEKLGLGDAEAFLRGEIERSICRAVQAGCHVFMTGMSRGFDLWAARTVLGMREELGVELWSVVPYDGIDRSWNENWRERYHEVLFSAERVYCLEMRYKPGCFYKRNSFMVENSCRLICYYDGIPGGTEYTVQQARKFGLEIDNLADRQLVLW